MRPELSTIRLNISWASIPEASPGVAVLILSQHVQQRYAEELLASGTGGVGYLLKQRVADVESFCADARRVAAGGTVLDPEVVSAVGTGGRHTRRSPGLPFGQAGARVPECVSRCSPAP